MSNKIFKKIRNQFIPHNDVLVNLMDKIEGVKTREIIIKIDGREIKVNKDTELEIEGRKIKVVNSERGVNINIDGKEIKLVYDEKGGATVQVDGKEYEVNGGKEIKIVYDEKGGVTVQVDGKEIKPKIDKRRLSEVIPSAIKESKQSSISKETSSSRDSQYR